MLLTRPRDEWLRRLAAAKVPAGSVNRIDQVASDRQLMDRGLIYTARDGGRAVPQVGLGIAVDRRPATYRLPPPRLGEHTAAVLSGRLSYEDAAIARLRAQHVL